MIGLLNAYRQKRDAPDYQLAYGPMFLRYLADVMPGVPVKEYEVALSGAPSDPNECEGWIVSGSPAGAYDGTPWIRDLGEFVRKCHTERKKILGVCFGHQLIAHFLGGRAERSPAGWGVGARKFRVLAHKPWMEPRLGEVSLLFSHQDQVVALPPGAELLAEDPFCPNQMFSIGAHVFSMQGHPEFTPEFARGRYDSRVERIGKPAYDAAIASLGGATNSREVGEWIRRFFE